MNKTESRANEEDSLLLIPPPFGEMRATLSRHSYQVSIGKALGCGSNSIMPCGLLQHDPSSSQWWTERRS